MKNSENKKKLIKKISKQKKYYLKYNQIIIFEKLSKIFLKNNFFFFEEIKKKIKFVKFPKFSFKIYKSFLLVLFLIFEKKKKKFFLKEFFRALKKNNIFLKNLENILNKKIYIQKSKKKLNFRKLVLFSKYFQFFNKIN